MLSEKVISANILVVNRKSRHFVASVISTCVTPWTINIPSFLPSSPKTVYFNSEFTFNIQQNSTKPHRIIPNPIFIYMVLQKWSRNIPFQREEKFFCYTMDIDMRRNVLLAQKCVGVVHFPSEIDMYVPLRHGPSNEMGLKE